jgi:hypothetical protein
MEILLAMLAVVFPGDLNPDDTVAMEQGVEYVGAQMPAEVSAGQAAELKLYFKVDEPLPDGVSNFLHVESATSDCRTVRDRAPTNYKDGTLVHSVSVRLPDSGECSAQTMDVYTGFYEVDGGRRYRVEGMTTPDNRIPAGSFELVAAGQKTDGTMQSWTASDIEWRRFFQELRPWWGWLGGLVLAIGLLAGLRWLVRREGRESGDADDTPAAWLGEGRTGGIDFRNKANLAGLGVVAATAIASMVVALDFVKDDAYISFRYAHNLVIGEGLVFNPGEYLEGFTNFLWTIMLAPFEAMGLDLFQVAEILGGALVLGLLYYLTKASLHLTDGARRDLSHLWGPLWLATSSSLALWSTSGMEQPLAMFLPMAGAYLLWTSWDDETETKAAAASGVLIGLACMTRPENHLIGIILGLPLVWRTVRDRRLGPITRYWFAGLFGITVPFHAFRLLYFGSLLPNTFYVKTGGSAVVLLRGVEKLHEMFGFNALGALALLMPLAFVDREHRREKIQAAAVAVGFMAYVVWVGDDEMTWHRLYLPALPFLVLIAVHGLRNICTAVVALTDSTGWRRLAVYGVGWALVLTAAGANFAKTYGAKGGFNGRGPLSGNYHPDIGKFLTRHAEPGSLVAFQDMGSTPYHAPDLKFLDFIGLVDETVAHARHDYGLHAFVSTGSQEEKAKYNAEMRDYFYERSPEWVILTSYIPSSRAGQVSGEFAKRPVPATLEPWIGTNTYQFDIYNQKFKQNYSHVRTWPRSATYYLSLFQRKSLRHKKPREVVVGQADGEVVGEPLDGVEATFEEGLKLRGSKVEPTAIEKQEFFVTTRWTLPGPMPHDLFFFLHVEKPGQRETYDHLPGDWMYPADRWQAGEVLEDRVLFQIPPSMEPGTYEVYMGAYYRESGERLKIVEGPDAGNNRLKLGTVRVRGFRPLLDHIIEPTRLDEQRKYPERIPDAE